MMDGEELRNIYDRLVVESGTDWCVEICDNVTPAEAFKRYQRSNQDGELYGFADHTAKLIMVFTKGVDPHETVFTLAHELGHTQHYDVFPDSVEWSMFGQEFFADFYAGWLLDRLGLKDCRKVVIKGWMYI